MKEIFASAAFGLAGLLIFFIFFMLLLLWLYRPGMKDKFKEHGNIPLEDDKI